MRKPLPTSCPLPFMFPLDSDWTQICLYIATKVCTAAGKETPGDIRQVSLNDYQMAELDRLKAWLYHRRIRARKTNGLRDGRGKKRRQPGKRLNSRRCSSSTTAVSQIGSGDNQLISRPYCFAYEATT